MSKDGGPAFPCVPVLHEGGPDSYWSQAGQGGMSLRDYFIAHAPFTLQDALRVYGTQEANLNSDPTRASVFAVWGLLCVEWADAMIKARGQ